VGTKEFAQAVVARVGQKPNRLKPVQYAKSTGSANHAIVSRTEAKMELRGIDIFVYWPSRNPDELAAAMGKFAGEGLALQMIDNRGVKVWPAGRAETFCTDSFRCRFMSEDGTDMAKCLAVVGRVAQAGIDIAMTESLRAFNGQPGFTLAQGQ